MADGNRSYRQDILFSSFYLDNLLPNDERWEKDQARVEEVFSSVRDLYQDKREYLEKSSEAETEQEFIEPLLQHLGFAFMRQPPPDVGGPPDYALFPDESLKRKSKKSRSKVDFSLSLGILEGKYWERPLDRLRADDNRDIEKSRRTNPNIQLTDYLFRTGCTWGVLTNGVEWRIFHRERSGRRVTNYYSVNLAKVLEEGTAEDFAYFYNLFRREAFEKDNGRCLLDRALEESLAYAHGIQENLKENVYKALRILAEGFFADANGELDRSSEADLRSVYDHSLIFLYRLLFICYAESPREGQYLLPIERQAYKDWFSLDAIKREIRNHQNPESAFSPLHHTIWDKLTTLFKLIDEGSGKRGIPEKQFVVPPYNGRLFDSAKYPFLTDHMVSDAHLWRVIDLIAHARNPKTGEREAVAYSNLDIRHLGSIYEGLLEHKLVVAKEEMVAVKNQWVPEQTVKGKKVRDEDRAKPGELYLTTDKGERKATGSYYTPDHIVKYIVEQALSPVIKDKRNLVDERVTELEEKVKTSRGRNRQEYEKQLGEARASIVDEILSIKVLDPAMGSGHFLVEATDHLARALVEELDVKAESLTEDDIRWARREVVEKCIYGVDLNPLAVELAKLSLWLSTVAVNKPLSFLDHHLREGNSLIGVRLEDLAVLPELKKKTKSKAATAQMALIEHVFRQQVHKLLEAYKQIAWLPSETVEDVKKKEEHYAHFNKLLERFRMVANCWVSVFFGNSVHPDDYGRLQEGLRDDSEWGRLSSKKFFERAQAIAAERRFFHWELEFPEIYYEKDRKKENPGFDCVVGNPPYDVLATKELGYDISAELSFYERTPRYAPAIRGKKNLYKLFICQEETLPAKGGTFSFIVPMALLGDDQASEVRRFLLENAQFIAIESFPQKDNPHDRVFPEAKLSTAVFVIKASITDGHFVVRTHPGRLIDEKSPTLRISSTEIFAFDPDNYTIPSCSQEDWDLAVEIINQPGVERLKKYAESFQGEVNETNEKKRKSITKDVSNPLILRGSNICMYSVREASQGEELHLNVRKFLQGRGKDTKAYSHKFNRVGFQRSSPQNNFRRIIAAPIERGSFCFDTVSYVTEASTTLNLDVLLVILNSKVLDWYFRLGSTSSKVNEYQFNNLPVPRILEERGEVQQKKADKVIGLLEQGDYGNALSYFDDSELAKGIPKWVEGVLAHCSRKIQEIEEKRALTRRTDRSKLAEGAESIQCFTDKVLYKCYGISESEAEGLEERLQRML